MKKQPNNPSEPNIHIFTLIIEKINESRKLKVPIWPAQLQICSAIRSGNDPPRGGRNFWTRFTSRLHSSIRVLAICNTVIAFRPYGPIADSPDNIRASAHCRTASETSATFFANENVSTFKIYLSLLSVTRWKFHFTSYLSSSWGRIFNHRLEKLWRYNHWLV